MILLLKTAFSGFQRYDQKGFLSALIRSKSRSNVRLKVRPRKMWVINSYKNQRLSRA
jgi:hypothetical protein